MASRLTNTNVLLDMRLCPLRQVTSLSTTHVQHLSGTSTTHWSTPHTSWPCLGIWARIGALSKYRVSKLGDEHALDPIIEVLHANDRRLVSLLNTNFWPCIVCSLRVKTLKPRPEVGETHSVRRLHLSVALQADRPSRPRLHLASVYFSESAIRCHPDSSCTTQSRLL